MNRNVHLDNQQPGDASQLAELARRTETRIEGALMALGQGGDFEWSGVPLSETGTAEVIYTDGLTVAMREQGGQREQWVIECPDPGNMRPSRVVQDPDGRKLVVELKPAVNVSGVEEKYERDRLLDVLQGCVRDRLGSENLLEM